ncbi:uncharacterized protein LOC116960357 isoform X1 [Tyto alba]|uniref:uncharacterized protein LOC116960357 isoform X1 n=1 Tax=Tyto alba TaxID=56313 RepID=UPI001C6639A5|nr:uncharacterized protein LOC116960357 isoform X1 [Tyto alba]
MEVCSPRQLPTGKKIWKVYVAAALAFGVATVVLAVALSSVLCQQAVGSMMAGNGSARLAWLEKELDVTNLSLAEARGQWEGCSKQLRVLEGKVLELEPALVRVTQLQVTLTPIPWDTLTPPPSPPRRGERGAPGTGGPAGEAAGGPAEQQGRAPAEEPGPGEAAPGYEEPAFEWEQDPGCVTQPPGSPPPRDAPPVIPKQQGHESLHIPSPSVG